MTALALVACSTAAADPGPAATGGPAAAGGPAATGGAAATGHPAGWKPLPAIASAVRAAATADGVAVDATDAWGEPARGCYSVSIELHGALHGAPADAPALADQVLASLPAPITSPGGGELSELVRPSGPDGILAFRFASPPYRGRLRARLGRGRIAAVACFFNQREPLACDAACTGVLAAVADAPATAGGAR
jgi:hypothetical protein